MKKTDGLVDAIMQGGMGYGDAKWIAGFVRTYLKEVLPKEINYSNGKHDWVDASHDLGLNDCLKQVNQALGLTE
jgi:hypothetical protein